MFYTYHRGSLVLSAAGILDDYLLKPWLTQLLDLMQAINRLSASYLWDGLILSLSLWCCFFFNTDHQRQRSNRGTGWWWDSLMVEVCHQCHIYTHIYINGRWPSTPCSLCETTVWCGVTVKIWILLSITITLHFALICKKIRFVVKLKIQCPSSTTTLTSNFPGFEKIKAQTLVADPTGTISSF